MTRPNAGYKKGVRFFSDDEDSFELEDILQVRLRAMVGCDGTGEEVQHACLPAVCMRVLAVAADWHIFPMRSCCISVLCVPSSLPLPFAPSLPPAGHVCLGGGLHLRACQALGPL